MRSGLQTYVIVMMCLLALLLACFIADNESGNSYSHHRTLRTLMRAMHTTFEKHNIPYIGVGGSLLGAVRHGDIIPWDDDIDVGILEPSVDRIIQTYADFAREDMYIATAPANFIESPTKDDIAESKGLLRLYSSRDKRAFIDIFILTEIGPDDNQFDPRRPIVRFKYSQITNRFMNQWWYLREVNNRKSYPFGYLDGQPCTMTSIASPERYLSTAYDDYMVERQTHAHTYQFIKSLPYFRTITYLIFACMFIYSIAILLLLVYRGKRHE